ncbi:hypothetical protein AIIKEEIJ_00584 [Rhodococcus sp. YH1]|nr:hypothetical protein [Rhodococcus sp. YH1]
MPRQPAHPPGELAVRQRLVPEHHRHRLRRPAHPLLEQPHQRHRRHRMCRVVPHLEHPRPLHRLEDLQVTHRHRRIRHHLLEHPHEPRREPRHRRRIEQIRRIGDPDRVSGGIGCLGSRFGEGELQVEPGGRGVEVEARDAQARQLEGSHRLVLEGQHHLEQRVPRRRPGGIEHLHQPLERHVRVRERVEVGPAYPREQVREGLPTLDPGAQHQGVDEHADQVVEFLLAAAGHRGADGDVVGARQPRQQHRQRRVHHHERGDVTLPRHPSDRGMEFRSERELVHRTRIGCERRPGPVRRQVELLGQPGERAGPVRFLARDHRVRIVLRSENLPLPQRVVGVLHRQGLPLRLPTGGARRVRHHHVTRERPHGEAVGRDVVHDEDENMLGRGHLEQPRPERHLCRHVEAGRGHRQDLAEQLGLGHRDRRQIGNHPRGRQHLLVRHPVGVRVHRPQGLVTGQHVGDRHLQRVPVQQSGQPDGQRDVVHRGVRFEPVEEPHPALRQRQRDPLRSGPRHQRRSAAGGVGLLEARGQGGDPGRLEQRPHRNRGAERRAETGDDLRGDERVAAQFEEVVVQPDAVHAEDVGEDPRDDLLDRGGRRPEDAGLLLRFRQCTPVELAAGRQRDRVQDHHRMRHHVARQELRHGIPDGGAVEFGARFGDDVPDELLTTLPVPAHRRDRLGDTGAPREGRLDLTEFDPEAADLHLVVGPADVLDNTGRLVAGRAEPPHHVTGAVHPAAVGGVRVCHEPLGRQPGPTQIPAGHLDSRQIQLAGDADRHRPQPVVENEHPHAADGAAHHHRITGQQRVADVRRHRRLGGTVGVEERAARSVGQDRRPARHQARGARLAARDHHADAVEARRVHRAEGSGGHEGMGDRFVRQQAGEFGAAVHGGRRDDHRRARAERQQQFENRRIEARRREVQRPGVGGDGIPFHLFGTEVHHAGMRDDHTLRRARRAGGVDDVRRMRRKQRAYALGVGHRFRRQPGAGLDRLLEHEPGHRARQRPSATPIALAPCALSPTTSPAPCAARHPACAPPTRPATTTPSRTRAPPRACCAITPPWLVPHPIASRPCSACAPR